MKIQLSTPVRIKQDTFDKYMQGTAWIVESLQGYPIKQLVTIKKLLKTRKLQPHYAKFMIDAGIIELSHGHYVLSEDCNNLERHRHAIRLHFDYIYNKQIKYVKL